MKKFMVLLIMAMLTVSVFGASAFDIKWGDQRTYSKLPGNTLRAWAESVEGSIGTGSKFYVDSGVATGGDSSGSSWTNAVTTAEAAIQLCTASRGDYIYFAPYHAESGVDAGLFDADIAGITLVGLGEGALAPTFTFADTDTTTVAGAADVTFINLRFLAGISEVVAGVIVEAAGTNFTMINCEFPEPLTSTFEFNTAVQLTTASNDATFIGNTAYSALATGADHWLNGGAGVIKRLTLIGNVIHGEYAIAPIFSDQIDLELFIGENTIQNMTTGQYAIEFSAAATGTLQDNKLYSDAWATILDPGSLKCLNNFGTIAINEQGIQIPISGDTSTVTANDAGSNLERLEQIDVDTSTIRVATGVTIPFTIAILDAAADPSASHANYFTVTADMTSATWNTAAAHEIAAVTGACRVKILVETTATVITTGTNGTMALGYAGNTSAIFSATVLDAALTNDVWTAVYGSAATTVVGGADAQSALTSALFDVVVVGGVDVGYTIATNAATTGTLTFHVWWTPLDATGAVTAGAGGPF